MAAFPRRFIDFRLARRAAFCGVFLELSGQVWAATPRTEATAGDWYAISTLLLFAVTGLASLIGINPYKGSAAALAQRVSVAALFYAACVIGFASFMSTVLLVSYGTHSLLLTVGAGGSMVFGVTSILILTAKRVQRVWR